MPPQNSIIIHKYYLILQGIKAVLNLKSITVTEMFQDPPLPSVLNGWKDRLIIIDIAYIALIQSHYSSLKKNHNIIFIVATDQDEIDNSWKLDEILLISDTSSTIGQKIDNLFQNVKSKRRSNQLSTRETDVLKLVALGDSNKQIADKLFISIHTAITHRKNITQKLGIKTIAGLTLYAVLNNLTD